MTAGVSPHAPYTVCGEQLKLIADYAQTERLPLMMHAAESRAEESLIRNGCGIVADSIPEEEYAESILKLRSMEIALGQSRMYGEETGASGRSAEMSTNSAGATS